MCGICGCGTHHEHHHRTHVEVQEDILSENNEYAAQNQAYFNDHHIACLNLMSSPGAGKTTLLAKTISAIRPVYPVAVMVGDQHTSLDANAIEAAEGRALQINTGQMCHLDAHQISHAIEDFPLEANSILFIENIGNLVCPALFKLGSHANIVLLSVAEGDNKPLKYPDIFLEADLLLITKCDLIPYVDFDVHRCIEYARRLRPHLEVMVVSAKTGEGMQAFYDWLIQFYQRVQTQLND